MCRALQRVACRPGKSGRRSCRPSSTWAGRRIRQSCGECSQTPWDDRGPEGTRGDERGRRAVQPGPLTYPSSLSVHQIGGTATIGGGGESIAAGVQGQLQISNGTQISDLGGPFGYGGASGGEGSTLGGDFFSGTNSCGQSIYGGDVAVGVGARFPIPGEIHGGMSQTWTATWWQGSLQNLHFLGDLTPPFVRG